MSFSSEVHFADCGHDCFVAIAFRHALHLSELGNMSWPNYGVCEEQTDQLSSSLFPKIGLKWCMHIMWWPFVWSGEMAVRVGGRKWHVDGSALAAGLCLALTKGNGGRVLAVLPHFAWPGLFWPVVSIRWLSCSICGQLSAQAQFCSWWSVGTNGDQGLFSVSQSCSFWRLISWFSGSWLLRCQAALCPEQWFIVHVHYSKPPHLFCLTVEG